MINEPFLKAVIKELISQRDRVYGSMPHTLYYSYRKKKLLGQNYIASFDFDLIKNMKF